MGRIETGDITTRVIEMRSVRNLRELGGYETTEGKRVRRGMLYRSGHLARLSRRDAYVLSKLNIATIVDFRSNEERSKEPDRLPKSHELKVVQIPMLDTANSILMQDIHARLKDNRFEDFNADELMRITNRQLVEDFVPEYRRFFEVLLDTDDRAVLFHCSGGKDRTGFASALILTILGVDRETIMGDYLLSNRYGDPARSKRLALRLFRGRTAADALGVLFEVRKSWLAAAFEAIDRRWEHFNIYREHCLGLTDDDAKTLKTRYLE